MQSTLKKLPHLKSVKKEVLCIGKPISFSGNLPVSNFFRYNIKFSHLNTLNLGFCMFKKTIAQ